MTICNLLHVYQIYYVPKKIIKKYQLKHLFLIVNRENENNLLVIVSPSVNVHRTFQINYHKKKTFDDILH